MTLHTLFSGAMMHARSTASGYKREADKLDRAVALILRSELALPATTLRQIGQ
jgi:hypothetical protein